MKIHRWLIPVSWLYGAGVWVRNTLFDQGVLRSQPFEIPIISVGNIAVGGTGKTPHVEYLVRLLSDRWRLAVLSRGYKRHTKGFVLGSSTTTAHDIGDEPKQLKSKFPQLTVAVDADRCHGIRRLMKDGRTKKTQVVILDDAFQHRYVRPGLNIVLIEYSRLRGDRLLPAGRLREPMRNIRRSDIVIVTKCPQGITEAEMAAATKEIRRYTQKPVFFSTMVYQDLEPIFCGEPCALTHLHPDTHVLLITGIAHPESLEAEIESHCQQIRHLAYPDHHDFSEADISDINHTFAAMPTPRILITTEKDAARLTAVGGLTDEVRQSALLLPICVEISDKEAFDRTIFHYLNSTQSSHSTLIPQ